MKKRRSVLYWAKHTKLKCECGAYEFPHRITSGACYRRKDKAKALFLYVRRKGGDAVEAQLLYFLTDETQPTNNDCPF